MMAESLRALLANVVDYAGLYPPAALQLPEVVKNYERYLVSTDAWMLNRLVLPMDKLGEVRLGEKWRVTLLVAEEPGPLPPQVETLETKLARRLSLPTYCELPLDRVENGYAKIRAATLSPEDLAAFLCGAAVRRLPFKATAGLHHPIRSATMHGFLNVLIAATFAWSGVDQSGMDQPTLTRLLNESDPLAFEFRNDGVQWREFRASTLEIEHARHDFMHSFGSCSFEEPVSDLPSTGARAMIDRTHEPGTDELGGIGQFAKERISDTKLARLRKLPAEWALNKFAWESPLGTRFWMLPKC